MRFKFHTNEFKRRGTTSFYDVTVLVAEAPTMEEAYEAIEASIPSGFRVWSWHVEEPNKEAAC